MFDINVGVLRFSEVCGAPFEKRTLKGTMMALTEKTKRRRDRGRWCMKKKKRAVREKNGDGRDEEQPNNKHSFILATACVSLDLQLVMVSPLTPYQPVS